MFIVITCTSGIQRKPVCVLSRLVSAGMRSCRAGDLKVAWVSGGDCPWSCMKGRQALAEWLFGSGHFVRVCVNWESALFEG